LALGINSYHIPWLVASMLFIKKKTYAVFEKLIKQKYALHCAMLLCLSSPLKLVDIYMIYKSSKEMWLEFRWYIYIYVYEQITISLFYINLVNSLHKTLL